MIRGRVDIYYLIDGRNNTSPVGNLGCADCTMARSLKHLVLLVI